MGSLSWGEIAKGLATLAGSLAAITLALNFMPKGMITKATGLIGVAAALTILVKPLREMSSMSWEEIGKACYFGRFNDYTRCCPECYAKSDSWCSSYDDCCACSCYYGRGSRNAW